MSEATDRLSTVQPWDRPEVLLLVGDAVWRVTVVDATLVRHHVEAYDAVLAELSPQRRG